MRRVWVRRHLPLFQWSHSSLEDHLALFTFDRASTPAELAVVAEQAIEWGNTRCEGARG